MRSKVATVQQRPPWHRFCRQLQRHLPAVDALQRHHWLVWLLVYAGATRITYHRAGVTTAHHGERQHRPSTLTPPLLPRQQQHRRQPPPQLVLLLHLRGPSLVNLAAMWGAQAGRPSCGLHCLASPLSLVTPVVAMAGVRTAAAQPPPRATRAAPLVLADDGGSDLGVAEALVWGLLPLQTRCLGSWPPWTGAGGSATRSTMLEWP